MLRTPFPSGALKAGVAATLIAALPAIGLVGAALAPALAPQPALAQRAAPDTFADLAERLTPAVVNISTAQTVDVPERGERQVPPGNPFEDLFRDFFDQQQRPQGPREVQSLGSGFVISPDGYVVTNNHVIEQADEITVNFADGNSLRAEVVGSDPKTDIALLKVEPDEELPHVPFGDSRQSRVGDWVLAIGNPFGLGGSVSAGIISARNRDINAGPYDDFIQTDAAINRGNSGGPLFNMDGEVIGVNTAIISPTGGSIGIGFAVPSALARNIVDQLQEYGTTRRGWLGVRIQSVNDEMAEALGLDRAQGALVADVTEGGPAAEAGLQQGDVILQFDGQPIDEMRDLPRIVADTEVGSNVRVQVFRKGKTQTQRVTVGRLEDQETVAAVSPDPQSQTDDGTTGGTSLLGMTLGEITMASRDRYSIPDDVSGVLITGVEDGGPAAEEGLAAGQVIVEVGQEPVSTPEDVREQVERVRGEGRSAVLLLVRAGGDLRFVPVSFPDE
ncbi:MAG: DegQ family serine endoprotease [Paracoccaceae bacterium]